MPHELYVDEHESIPEDVLKRIRVKAIDHGLWPMNVPVEMGGLGSSVMEQVVGYKFHRGALACGRRRESMTVDELMAGVGADTDVTLIVCPVT